MMDARSLIKLLFVLLVGLMTACSITKPYSPAQVGTENLYRDVTASDTNTIASLPYNQVFTDTVLQNLIARGIRENIDLKVAYLRVQQAQEYYQQSRAAFLPSLNANAGVTVSKLSDAVSFGARSHSTQYQLGLSTAWEADIWGKLSSSKRANLASLLQTEAAARAVQTSLVAGIANFYYTLLALDQQLAITRQTVTNWDTTVNTMQALKEAARVTEAAVVQSEAQRYAAEVTIPDLKQRIRETENALSILLGAAPGSISRGTLENQQTPGVLKTGVPAQLLANRPDVLQAELNFRYYFELTNVARTYFYPALTITGSSGFASLNLTDLFKPGSLTANVAAGLTQPILNRRTNKTRLRVAESQQEAALLGFQNTLLTAGQEVSDALFAYSAAADKIGIRINQLSALQKSVEYSQELLRNGFANYTEVITARQSLLQAQLGKVNDRFQQLQAVVNLYRSLGGGWK